MRPFQLFMLAVAAGSVACAPDAPTPSEPAGPLFKKAPAPAPETSAMATVFGSVNVVLGDRSADFRLATAEWLGDAEAGEQGQIVFFLDRGNKQLPHDFVPGDPRRGGGTNITYIVDATEGAIDGLTQAQTDAAIDRAMATWDGVRCSTLPVTKQPRLDGVDLGVIEFIFGLGGSDSFFADITHAGWLPAGLLPNNVIGVTFTFIWVTEDDVPTDIDNNGKADVAFREILYNNAFLWRINGNIDVETVALHEAGHGLSQAHFGKAFITLSNGKLHFAPRAVMNAAYSGVQQALAGTDNGGHCSIWASWPNN